MSASVRLDAASVEAVARRVVELLRDQPPPGRLFTAAEIASAFSIRADWVREHADELGAIRVGDGPRPRLRFDPAVVRARLEGLRKPAPPIRPGRRREAGAATSRPRTTQRVALLPGKENDGEHH